MKKFLTSTTITIFTSIMLTVMVVVASYSILESYLAANNIIIESQLQIVFIFMLFWVLRGMKACDYSNTSYFRLVFNRLYYLFLTVVVLFAVLTQVYDAKFSLDKQFTNVPTVEVDVSNMRDFGLEEWIRTLSQAIEKNLIAEDEIKSYGDKSLNVINSPDIVSLDYFINDYLPSANAFFDMYSDVRASSAESVEKANAIKENIKLRKSYMLPQISVEHLEFLQAYMAFYFICQWVLIVFMFFYFIAILFFPNKIMIDQWRKEESLEEEPSN